MVDYQVETQYYQVEKPTIKPKDRYGNNLWTGKKCAFNKSGAVVLGEIKGVARWEWKASRNGTDEKKWWSIKCEIHVQEFGSNKISKLKNPNSIIVI